MLHSTRLCRLSTQRCHRYQWQYFFNKRTRTLDTPQHTNVPELDSALRHILQAVTLFAKENMHAISGLDIDLPSDGSTIVFGMRRPDLPGRKYVSRTGFQTNPWVRGVVPYPPRDGVAELLEQYFISDQDSELAGNFLVHEEPRFIRITGLVIRQQLVGDNLIGHELMSMLFRRFAQLDVQAETKNPNLSWRHPIEPEFSTLVLSDSDFIHTVSIQKYLSIC